MKNHPTDMLPAYALGVLDEEAAQQVREHLALCPACRESIEDFCAAIALPHDTCPVPSRHLKQQLMERVHRTPTRRHQLFLARSPVAHWSSVLMLVSLALVFLFGGMFMTTRRQLASAQQTIQTLQASGNSRESAIAALLSQPNTSSQPLHSSQPETTAAMYAQPGERRAVLLAAGLPAPASGMTYQCWFASGPTQISAAVFSVDANGAAQVLLDAPAPIHSYYEVMVTVEPSGGSAQPSGEVILSAKLVS